MSKKCLLNKKAGRNTHAGFTLVEIMIVVAIIGLLGAIAIPNFVKARRKAQETTCIGNLRHLDDAKQRWALETGKGHFDVPADTDLQPYFGRGTAGSLTSMYCPLDPAKTLATSYDIGNVGTATSCKFSHVDLQDHGIN